MDIDTLLLLYVAQRRKKKTRRVWVHEIIQKRDEFGESNTLLRELSSFEDKFHSYFLSITVQTQPCDADLFLIQMSGSSGGEKRQTYSGLVLQT